MLLSRSRHIRGVSPPPLVNVILDKLIGKFNFVVIICLAVFILILTNQQMTGHSKIRQKIKRDRVEIDLD